jgi:hypothetical protein
MFCLDSGKNRLYTQQNESFATKHLREKKCTKQGESLD